MAAATFPDVEAAMVAALSPFSPPVAAGKRVGTETPADLANRLPFIRVARRGGPSDSVTDRARVDVEVFAATRAQGVTLTEQIRQHLIAPAPARPGDPFDGIECASGPQELPWGDNRTVRRWINVYTVSSRRRTA